MHLIHRNWNIPGKFLENGMLSVFFYLEFSKGFDSFVLFWLIIQIINAILAISSLTFEMISVYFFDTIDVFNTVWELNFFIILCTGYIRV